jgi:hypothetical protein
MAKSAYKQRVIPEGMSQVNFNLKTSLLEKVRAIAIKASPKEDGGRYSNSDVLNEAVKTYVELYEKRSGKIKPLAKGKGLDVI